MSNICTKCENKVSKYYSNEYKLCKPCYEELDEKFFKISLPFTNPNEIIDTDKALEFMKLIDTSIDTPEGIFLFKNELKIRRKYYLYDMFLLLFSSEEE